MSAVTCWSMLRHTALLVLSVIVSVMARADSLNKSHYTDINNKACKLIQQDEESDGSAYHCPGFRQYGLKWIYADARDSIDIVTPDKREIGLDFSGKVGAGFSSLGKKAEWRYKVKDGKKVVVALIVRLNVVENPQFPGKTTSYLVVSRLLSGQICIVGKVRPVRNANLQARQIADTAATRKCL